MTRSLAPLSFLVVLKVALSLLIVISGFVAISDDDFSRLVIAQSFARTPRFDPSGTSWLPLPFITYGTVFAVFGNSLAVARITGVLFGALSVTGIYRAARWLTLGRREALLAALFGAFLPHAVFYGTATVPDYPTAVLVLLGAASTSSTKARVRILGALAVAAATLCRYEAWSVALVVAGFALVDLFRARGTLSPLTKALASAAVIAPLGAFGWLLHGALNHRDAFFFVKRVASYKRALGGSPTTLVDALLTQPVAFFRGEPELVLVTVALLVAVALGLGRKGFAGAAWKRPTLALGALLAFLVVGDLRDGSPTHHGDRVLLSLWLGLSIVVSELLTRLVLASNPRRAPLAFLGSGLGLLVAVTALYVRPAVTKEEPFVERSRELALGQRLAALLPVDERVALYTEDYGYFAVDAALGRPGRVLPLKTHDPRRPQTDPLSSLGLLAARLDALGARTFVVPATRETQVGSVYERVEQVAGFTVFRRN